LLDVVDMSYQITQAPSLGSRVQLVIVTTNMPPIPPIRAAEDLLPTISDSMIYSNDVFDSWSFPAASFDMMVLTLSNRLPLDSGTPPAHSGAVIVLSGDVHTSYASRLQYWADKRFGDATADPHPATVVFAQLVASPFKNESDGTRGQHYKGYSYVPHTGMGLLLPKEKPDGVYGWAVPSGSKTEVTVGSSTSANALGGMPAAMDFRVSGVRPSVTFEEMSSTSAVASKSTTISTPPDYQYRTEQIYVAASGQAAAVPPLVAAVGVAVDPAARKAALQSFNSAIGAYRNYNSTAGKGRQIVGRSNICEITFSGTATNPQQVHQTVRWYETTTQDGNVVDTSTVWWARYDVSLALNDTQHYGKLPFPPP
jgi:hypothetical protein